MRKPCPTKNQDVDRDHLLADDYHAVEPVYDDGVADHCAICGLAIVWDGSHHGFHCEHGPRTDEHV